MARTSPPRIGRTVLARPVPIAAAALAGVLLVLLALAQAAAAAADPGVVQGAVDRYRAAMPVPGVAAATTTAEGKVVVAVSGRDGNGDPVTGDTRFMIASMSKAFTATAVMQQVDAGRLTLDDRVADRLPELRLNDSRAAEMTVRQLLNHTSGLSLSTYDEYRWNPPGSPAQTVEALRGTRLAAAPGQRFEYSNTGYSLAARIVEISSGMSFDSYLQAQILRPLGMNDTVVVDRCDASAPGLSRGFITIAGRPVPVREMRGGCSGNGGLVSTVTDMARWMVFQTGDGTAPGGGRLLTKASLDLLHTPVQGVTGSDGYALGWRVEPAKDGVPQRIGHGGTLTTFTSFGAFVPATGAGAVVLGNAVGDPSQLVGALLSADPAGATFSDPLRWVNLGLLVTTVLAALVLLLVIARSGRWARRLTAEGSRTWWRSIPLLLVALLGAALPFAFGALQGVATPFAYVLTGYLIPMGAALTLVLSLGGLLALWARIRAVRRARRKALPAGPYPGTG